MKTVDFKTSNYEDKETLATFLNSFNDLLEKYEKGHVNADATLRRVENNIEKKNASIEKIEGVISELEKREEELKTLKASSNDEIKDLEEKKKSVDYTDSEVKKMELEDLETLVTSKRSKINKIETKLEATREKEKANNDAKREAEKELRELEKERKLAEESLLRTNAILELVGNTKESFNKRIDEIMDSEFVEVTIPLEEPKVEEEPVANDFTVENYDLKDMETPKMGNVEPIEIIDPTLEKVEEVKPTLEPVTEEKTLEDTMSILEFDVQGINEETDKQETVENKEEVVEEKPVDYRVLLEDVFNKEAISFTDFSSEVQEKLLENANCVIKNVVVLKKHKIPLELTLNQHEIYYGIEPQDLDDLLNIITTDEDGNGMGFTIDFTFYVLNELSKINVDRLIDVYNNEFMNVNAKSGIIWLLKLTNPELTDFANNRKMNLDTLASLGVTTGDKISEEYPELVNLDNPLFLNALNLFDKDDLVNKLNTDTKIVPKILEYWKNN